MAAVAPAPPAMATTFPRFRQLPGEIQNMVWAFVQGDVVHYFFRYLPRPYRPRRGAVRWKAPRGYVTLDPISLGLGNTEFRMTGNRDPEFLGIPESLGHVLNKVRLPNAVHGPRGTMTYYTSRDEWQYKNKPTPSSRNAIYVHFRRDVFYFGNGWTDLSHMGPAPPHRLGDLQYLSDNSLQNVLANYTKVVPPGELSWVRRIHKLAIEWAYLPSLVNMVNIAFWFMNEIGPIMGNFNAAQRLYIVLNARDLQCPLVVSRRPDTVEGSDGFVQWWEFVEAHRQAALANLNNDSNFQCYCELPDHNQPAGLTPLAAYNHNRPLDLARATNWNTAVLGTRVLLPWRLPPDIYYVVNNL